MGRAVEASAREPARGTATAVAARDGAAWSPADLSPRGRSMAALAQLSREGPRATVQRQRLQAAFGDAAGQKSQGSHHPATQPASASAGEAVVQRRLGFEIEMLALVDINGRPIPEKAMLGTIGPHNVEMTVDHGQAVAAPTPTPAYEAQYSVPDMGPGLPPAAPGPLLLGPYDTPMGTQTRLDFPIGAPAPAIDPRLAVPVNLLDRANFNPGMAAAGVDLARPRNPDNRPLYRVGALLQHRNYRRLFDNFERATAMAVLVAVQAELAQWALLNPNANHRWGRPASNLRRTTRFNAANGQVGALQAEVLAQNAMWAANLAPHAAMDRQYLPAGGVWGPNHPRFRPIDGMGTDRYASILELVTPGIAGFEPETAPGRLAILAAMTEAVNFAVALQAAVGPGWNRVPLSGVPGVNNVTNPAIHVGNPLQPNQTTDASLQATMAVDLAQIASLFKSLFAAGNRPQNLFTAKHDSDPVGAMGMPAPRTAETAAARAPLAARNVIRNRLGAAGVAGWGGNLTHLRGLFTLICQYLLMGRHALLPTGLAPPNPAEKWNLDKNIVPLLSRNDLGLVTFNELVPPVEQALVGGVLQGAVIAALLAETGRAAGAALFNRPADNLAPGPPAPYNLTNAQFIANVLSGLADGVTGNLGGFHQFHHSEDVDPAAARGGDYRRAGPAHREGAIFELRNIVPADALMLPTDRLPSGQWLPLATHLVDTVAALNARTEAQSANDTRYNQALGALQNQGAW